MLLTWWMKRIDEYILHTNSNLPRPVPTASGDAHDNIYRFRSSSEARRSFHAKLFNRFAGRLPENRAGIDQHPGVLAPGWNEDVVKNLPVLLGIFNRFKASAEKNKYKMLTSTNQKQNKKVTRFLPLFLLLYRTKPNTKCSCFYIQKTK